MHWSQHPHPRCMRSDKLRRSEDFKHSFHNSTLVAYDVPTHHTVGSYVHPCRYTILFTPAGAILWCHTALCFGASASVWAFNRCADVLQFLARKLLWTPVHHFVDDFAAIEDDLWADSGFQNFQSLFDNLGLRMKEKKACAPKRHQKLLGVIFSIQQHQVSLQVCPDRLTYPLYLDAPALFKGQVLQQEA